jgi:hypothetical protein
VYPRSTQNTMINYFFDHLFHKWTRLDLRKYQMLTNITIIPNILFVNNARWHFTHIFQSKMHQLEFLDFDNPKFNITIILHMFAIAVNMERIYSIFINLRQKLCQIFTFSLFLVHFIQHLHISIIKYLNHRDR